MNQKDPNLRGLLGIPMIVSLKNGRAIPQIESLLNETCRSYMGPPTEDVSGGPHKMSVG